MNTTTTFSKCPSPHSRFTAAIRPSEVAPDGRVVVHLVDRIHEISFAEATYLAEDENDRFAMWLEAHISTCPSHGDRAVEDWFATQESLFVSSVEAAEDFAAEIGMGR